MFLPDSPTTAVGGPPSGRLGTTIYAHGHYGPYSYTFTPRVDPLTARQSAVRALFRNAAVIWAIPWNKALRAAWEAYARNVPRSCRGGSCRHLTGLNYYVGSQTFREQNRILAPSQWPVDYTLARYRGTTLFPPHSPPYDEVTAFFHPLDPWRRQIRGGWGLYASQPQSNDVNYFKGPYHWIGSTAGRYPRPPFSLRVSLVSYPSPGQVVFFRTRITLKDGTLSPSHYHRLLFP